MLGPLAAWKRTSGRRVPEPSTTRFMGIGPSPDLPSSPRHRRGPLGSVVTPTPPARIGCNTCVETTEFTDSYPLGVSLLLDFKGAVRQHLD